MLLTTSLSVTDICFEVGYSSLGSFITLFTRLVGLPPRHLRLAAEHFAMPSPESLGNRVTEGEPESPGIYAGKCQYILAVALPLCDEPRTYLLPDSATLVGMGAAPLLMREGRMQGLADVTMRTPRLTDPPMVVALPFV